MTNDPGTYPAGLSGDLGQTQELAAQTQAELAVVSADWEVQATDLGGGDAAMSPMRTGA